MLTPHEFVVNATSARANRGLLELNNNARRPITLDVGGPVGEAPTASAGVSPGAVSGGLRVPRLKFQAAQDGGEIFIQSSS